MVPGPSFGELGKAANLRDPWDRPETLLKDAYEPYGEASSLDREILPRDLPTH